jgi:hypothetical protein
MKRVIASASLLALGAAGVHNAMAQELESGQGKPWSVAGTFRGFYDDNYATAPSGPARRGSFGMQISPAIYLNTAPGQTTLNISYVYSLLYFGDRPGNHFDQTHDFELLLSHNFDANWSVSFSDGFVIAQDPQLLSATAAVAFPLRADGDNMRNAALITLNGQLTPLWGLVLSYNNVFYDFKQNHDNESAALKGIPSYSALLDRIEQIATLEVHWSPWRQTTGILGYQFGAVNYLSSESVAPETFIGSLIGGYPTPGDFFDYVNPNTRNNYTHSVYIGAEHHFSSVLTGSVRVGGQYADFYNAPAGNPRNALSPYASLSLSYNYMEGGVFTLGFSHARNQTDLAASGPLITEDDETSVVYGTFVQSLKAISPNLTATLNAQFQNSLVHGGQFQGRTENMYLIGLDFNYRFNQFLSADLGYNYDKLSSDIVGRSYDRNRVYLGLTANY